PAPSPQHRTYCWHPCRQECPRTHSDHPRSRADIALSHHASSYHLVAARPLIFCKRDGAEFSQFHVGFFRRHKRFLYFAAHWPTASPAEPAAATKGADRRTSILCPPHLKAHTS